MQVVIELVPDTSKVESSLDQLQRKGQVTDTSAQAFKKGNDELTKRASLLQTEEKLTKNVTSAQQTQLGTITKIEKATGQLANGVLKISAQQFQQGMIASGKTAENYVKTLAKGTAETKNNTNATKSQTTALNENTNAINSNISAEESLKTKLREIKHEVALLLATEDTWTEESKQRYHQLVEEAGRYQDAVNDASAAISNAGSDTRGLDNVLSVAQGVTAGFAIVQGAAALFGKENEELQKTLLKVNAAMAILQGLQQIQDLLSQKHIQSLFMLNKQQFVNNANIAIENGLQSKSVIVRTAATVAQRALNAAMAVSPLGWLAIALAAVVTGLLIFSNRSKNAAKDQRDLATAVLATYDAVQKQNAIFNSVKDREIQNAERELALAKARGASTDAIYNMELRLANLRVQRAEQNKKYYADEIANADVFRKRLQTLYSQQSELSGKEDEDSTKRRGNIEKEITLLEAKIKNGIDAETEYNNAVIDLAAKKTERFKEQEERTLRNKKANIETELVNVKKGSAEELALKIQLAEAEKAIALKNADLTQGEKKLIIAKTEKEISDMRKALEQAEALRSKEFELLKAQNKVLAYTEGTKEYFAAQEEFLNAQADYDILQITQSTEAEETKSERIKQVRLKLHKDLAELDKASFEKEINSRHEKISLLQQAELNGLTRQSQDVTISENKRFEALQQSRLKRLELLESERSKDADLASKGVITYEEYEKRKSEIKEQEEQTRFEISQAYAEREKAIRVELADFAFNAMSETIQAVGRIESANRQAQLEAELSRLETEKDNAINNKNITEAQKTAIEKRYNAEIRKTKTEAARRERTAQVNQAIALGVMSVLKSLAEYAWPYNLIAAAAAAVSTGIQIAELRSTPVPQYYVGTKSAKKGWAWVGEKGPELVQLKGGERILTHEESKKVSTGWSKGLSDPDAILAGNLPTNSAEELSNYIVSEGGNIQLDYDKIGKSIAKHMPKQASFTVQADANGFSMYIDEGNKRTQIRNEKYSYNP